MRKLSRVVSGAGDEFNTQGLTSPRNLLFDLNEEMNLY